MNVFKKINDFIKKDYKSPILNAGFMINPYNFAAVGPVGGWKELGRTTLGSAGDTINVSSLANKRYLMVIVNGLDSGNLNIAHRFNSDSGNNYAKRSSNDGGADGLSAPADNTLEIDGMSSANPRFGVGYIANYSTKEKLGIIHGIQQNTVGAGNAPRRMEGAGKWVNTTDAINSIQSRNFGSGDFASGSELVVLGYDPADTHTTNFWEELASADWSSGSSLPTVSFTSKKYLWVQSFVSGGIGGDGANRVSVRVGNGSIDTGNNYAFSNSENGGGDSTTTSTNRFLTHTGDKKNFMNMFIINNASNEKLVMYHTSESSGTGAGSAPSRIEGVGKWANTSNQIDRISVFDYTGGNNFNAGTIKVWGSN